MTIIIAGSSLELTEVSCFFLSWPLTRYWFSIGLQAPPRLTHLNINKASFSARFLWLDMATQPYYINYSSYTVTAFCVQVENSLEDVFFLHFSLVSIPVRHYHDTCGPQWWLCSYLSQVSEGYKLKAECLFLICLDLLFSLYCNFWHIFRSSDKVTWCLEDLWPEQNERRAKENNNNKTEYQ